MRDKLALALAALLLLASCDRPRAPVFIDLVNDPHKTDDGSEAQIRDVRGLGELLIAGCTPYVVRRAKFPATSASFRSPRDCPGKLSLAFFFRAPSQRVDVRFNGRPTAAFDCPARLDNNIQRLELDVAILQGDNTLAIAYTYQDDDPGEAAPPRSSEPVDFVALQIVGR